MQIANTPLLYSSTYASGIISILAENIFHVFYILLSKSTLLLDTRWWLEPTLYHRLKNMSLCFRENVIVQIILQFCAVFFSFSISIGSLDPAGIATESPRGWTEQETVGAHHPDLIYVIQREDKPRKIWFHIYCLIGDKDGGSWVAVVSQGRKQRWRNRSLLPCLCQTGGLSTLIWKNNSSECFLICHLCC